MYVLAEDLLTPYPCICSPIFRPSLSFTSEYRGFTPIHLSHIVGRSKQLAPTQQVARDFRPASAVRALNQSAPIRESGRLVHPDRLLGREPRAPRFVARRKLVVAGAPPGRSRTIFGVRRLQGGERRRQFARGPPPPELGEQAQDSGHIWAELRPGDTTERQPQEKGGLVGREVCAQAAVDVFTRVPEMSAVADLERREQPGLKY